MLPKMISVAALLCMFYLPLLLSISDETRLEMYQISLYSLRLAPSMHNSIILKIATVTFIHILLLHKRTTIKLL
jgi:hypothetical protein